jgi:hypothetical protein
MIVACAALFVALGGVGYAAATIGSAQIKNNSIQGKDVKNSSLTGKDVKNSSLTGSDIKNNSLKGSDVLESSLGKVPSAGSADTANSASSANSANSANSAGSLSTQRKILYRAGQNTSAQVIYNNGRLSLSASCGAAGALTLTASSTVNHAAIQSYGNGGDTNDDDFLTTETPTISSADEERDLVYTDAAGHTTEIQYSAASGAPFGQGNSCAVTGLAQTL